MNYFTNVMVSVPETNNRNMSFIEFQFQNVSFLSPFGPV